MASETQWAWLAGMIDGDGCIKLAMNRSPTVHMEIGTNDEQLARYILTTFGGRIDNVKQPNGRPFYRWVATSEWLRDNLHEIIDHLVYKHRQAIAATELLRLRLVRQGRGGRFMPERQDALMAEIRAANNHIWDRSQRGI